VSPVVAQPGWRSRSVRSAMVDGQTILHGEGLTVPGVYTMSTPQDPAPRPALALNMARTESDLTADSAGSGDGDAGRQRIW